jgi:Fic family protein
MIHYIHQHLDWPAFFWDDARIMPILGEVRNLQGRITGRMESLGFDLQQEAGLETLTLDILKSTELEGERLDASQVRSSLARRLGLDIAGAVESDRHVDGMVDMMLDATRNYDAPLTAERLFGWHSALFPAGRSGMYLITVGAWRTDARGPMQVVSGPMGLEKVHFQAPDAVKLEEEMRRFLEWFGHDVPVDPVVRAAIAQLWFVTIHPFDDGNGRIARALADMMLARSDRSRQRFYSMSARIRKERRLYYDILERTQKGSLEITPWLLWFLDCLLHALQSTGDILARVLHKAAFWQQHSDVRLNDRQRRMLNLLLGDFRGKLTSSKWAAICNCSSDTALRDIHDLIEKDILRPSPSGGRSTSYEMV